MFGKVKESEQHLNINWKHFYLSVLALVIPMALQNLINVGVTAADVVMLGKVGEHALSGASLAGQVQYIMTLFFIWADFRGDRFDCSVLGEEGYLHN